MVHPVDTLVFVTLGSLTISTMGISTMSLALMLWGARRGGQKVLIASAFASLWAARLLETLKQALLRGVSRLEAICAINRAEATPKAA